jgi:hypothetical protein
MSTFHAAMPELDGFVSRFRNGAKIVTEELAIAGKKAGLLVERKAKEYAPVWRGHLRRSITSSRAPFGTTTTPLMVTTKIGSNLPYAAAQNFGRPADAPMPPPGALLPWMAAKGIPATEANIAGTRRVRDQDGNVVGSIIRGTAGLAGPRRYLPIEYLIARSIKRSAPKPNEYLTKAFRELQPQIRAEFRQVPKRVIARLQAGG